MSTPVDKPSLSRTNRRHMVNSFFQKSKYSVSLKEVEEIIHNDTDYILSKPQIQVLKLGSSFIPSKQLKKESLKQDLEKLRRELNLKFHWQVRPSDTLRSSLISKTLKSEWMPPGILHQTTKCWETLVEKMTNTSHKQKTNFPRHLQKAWKELCTHQDFYLLKADKGGKMVMWKKSDYRKEGLRQLNDNSTYQELTKEEAEERYQRLVISKGEICNTLRKNGNITSAEFDRLLKEETRIPSIYFLPKIHKEKRPDTQTYAGRPIVAAVGGCMKTLDEYIANLTAQLLHLIPGSLMDTRHLLNDLESLDELPENCQLFSADVESLYPNIQWKEGKLAATRFYTKHFHDIIKQEGANNRLPPPTPAVFQQILTLVLEENIFHFQDSKWFRQLKGTAMGCSISVYLANTFLYYRTRYLIEKPPRNLIYMGRYIDDIVGIWNGNLENIEEIFKEATDEDVRLTYVKGVKDLEALDLLLSIENGRVKTKLFTKPTAGHQFIHWTSAHPRHVKKSVIYSQLLRIKRNCSQEEDFEQGGKLLLEKFKERGYPANVIEEQERKASKIARKDLLKKPTEENKREHRFTLVTDLTEQSKDWNSHITEFWKELHSSEIVQERARYVNGKVLPKEPPRIAYRAGESLQSQLGPKYKRGTRDGQGAEP